MKITTIFLLLLINIICCNSTIKFLDFEYESFKGWRQKKEEVHSLFSKGTWKNVPVTDFPMLYNKPCIHVCPDFQKIFK